MAEAKINGQTVNYYLITWKRVAKVTAGAKRLSISVSVAVGDKQGHVGVATAKGRDFSEAVNKALNKAYRKMIEVPVTDIKSIPFRITGKFKAAHVMLKPAPDGVGLVAGGAIRKVLEVAGYENVVAKRMGAANALANAYCVVSLLHKLSQKVHDKGAN